MIRPRTSRATIGDPATLKATIEAVVPYRTVDSAWSTGDLRSLALDLRHLKPSRITYATVPLDHYETIDGVGAANIIDGTRVDELFTAVQDER